MLSVRTVSMTSCPSIRALRFVVLVIAFFIGAPASSARADEPEPEVTLTWDAPPGCPDRTYVLEEVHRRLVTSERLARRVSAEARVTRSASGFRVELTTHVDEVRGRRRFRADSCQALADATALVLALLVDPTHGADRGDEPASEPPPEQEPPPPPPRALEPSPTRKLGGFVAAFGAADLGTAPRVGMGAGLLVGLAYARWRLALAGGYEPAHDASLGDRAGIGASFRKATGAVRGCYAVTTGTLEVDGCVAQELANLRAKSFGISAPRSGSATWTETTLGTSLRIEIAAGVGLRAEGFVGFPLTRQEFAIAPLGIVHTLPFLTGRLGIGLDVRF